MNTQLAALVGSTTSTTIVLVAALVLVGLVMIGVAIWLVRSTRRDSPALAPLEVMGERRWRRSDDVARAGALTEARPDGAPPPAPTVPFDAPSDQPSPNGELAPPNPVVSAHTSTEGPAVDARSEA